MGDNAVSELADVNGGRPGRPKGRKSRDLPPRRVEPDAPHGTRSGYSNWRCGCEPCLNWGVNNNRKQKLARSKRLSATRSTAEGPIDLNLADEGALQGLPGIGQARAAQIVQWRSENGPFAAVEDLQEIEGVGPEMVNRVRPYVTV